MKYVSVFYEGEHNDARTNLCIAFTAAMYGAAIANYAKALGLRGDSNGCRWSGSSSTRRAWRREPRCWTKRIRMPRPSPSRPVKELI